MALPTVTVSERLNVTKPLSVMLPATYPDHASVADLKRARRPRRVRRTPRRGTRIRVSTLLLPSSRPGSHRFAIVQEDSRNYSALRVVRAGDGAARALLSSATCEAVGVGSRRQRGIIRYDWAFASTFNVCALTE